MTDDDRARPPEDRLTRVLYRSLGGAGALVLFALMMVTVVDVAGRYLFLSPLPGGSEITQLMMAALIYVGLPVVSRREQHITIDLLDRVTPGALARPRDVLVSLLGAVAFAVLAWELWGLAEKIRDFGDVTEYLRWPRAPMIYAMSVFSGLASLVLFANVVGHAGRTRPSGSGTGL